jgi:8-oxo-dGTP pyrophosphatase MutT (NUDIX family)
MELPKGKLEPGEAPLAAAVRELREETGLLTPVDLVRELPRVRYAFRTPEGKSVFKVVHYFLFMSRDPAPVFVPQGKEGIVAVEWTPLRHALGSIAFGNLRPVLEAARDALESGAPTTTASADEELFPET